MRRLLFLLLYLSIHSLPDATALFMPCFLPHRRRGAVDITLNRPLSLQLTRFNAAL